jgi:hypothetical protein
MKRAGELLAVMILSLSAVLAWRLGFSLGASDVEKHILALISVALEGWKVLLPFVAYRAWQARRLVALGFALVAWPLLTAYSFIGGLGFSEWNRASVAGDRGAAVARAESLRAEAADLTARLAAIPTNRTPNEITAAIAAREQTPIRAGTDTKPLLAATNQCQLILSKRTVELCAEIGTLRQEQAQAHERQRLDARLTEVRAALAQISGLAWEGVADPQVAAVAALIGTDITTTRRVINVAFAALLEIIGGLGLFFASLLAPPEPAQRRSGATERDPVVHDEVDTPTDEQRLARYLAIRTRQQAGVTIVASKLHADYSRWAHEQGAAPVSLTTFGNLIAKQGIAKEKVEGLMHYQNIAFVEPPTAKEAA